jgi:Gpi18-like mannosyltransferase
MKPSFRLLMISVLFTALFMQPLLADTENLTRNPGFEQPVMSGPAVGWTLVHWDVNNAVVGDIDADIFQEGSGAFRLDVPAPDDARIEQVIPVLADHWYRFSAWVKTRDVPDDRVGANLSIIGSMEHSPDVRGTQDWQEIEVWGKTAADQTEIKLAARLGFYGATTTGQVWFDDIQVQAVDAPPAGAPRMLLAAQPATEKATETETDTGFLVMNTAAMGIALAYILFALVVVHQRQVLATVVIQPGQMAMIVMLALALKLALAGYYLGYSADINTFSSWAMDLYRLGPSAFYRPDYFADYPPGYMYVLWCVGAIAHYLELEFASPAFLMVLKLPSILADVLAAWWLFRLGNHSIDPVAARVAALLWLLNPLVIITSSGWGQVDSIFTLVLVLSLVDFENDRFERAAGWYALAVILKPQALLLAPLSLIALIRMPDWRRRGLSVGSFFAVALLLILPFAWQQESPWWIFSLYGGTLGSYSYLTLNAFNLYALLDANWLSLETSFLGLDVGKWAWLLVAGGLLPVIYCSWRSRVSGRYLWGAAAIVAVFFVFGPKMHERYLFPAALFSFMSWLWLQDRRLLTIAIGFSVTCFINIWVTLDSMARLNTSFVPYEQWLLPLVSFVNVGLAVYLLYTGWQVLIYRRCRPLYNALFELVPSGEMEVSETRKDT